MADDAGGEGGSRGGSAPTEPGSSPAGRAAGGSAAGADPTAAGAGQGGDSAAGEDGSRSGTGEGHGGEPAAGAGGQPPKPTYINGCFSFVDRTDEAAGRSILWNDALIFDPMRCLRVRIGQTVTFAGDHDSHPMIPQGGDTPNPVGPTVAFTEPGIFGYVCIPHPSEMNGAIEVVP